jgi:hypothetical protein
MNRIYESKLTKGFIDLYEANGKLIVRSAFRREVQGVALEVPVEEAADLAEALLNFFDEPTRTSVVGAVINEQETSKADG